MFLLPIISCSRGEIQDSAGRGEDSLVLQCLKQNFSNYSEGELKYWLTKADSLVTKEIILYPGPYRFRLDKFGDGQQYTPFVIRVKDKRDSLIDLFTFSDELYHLNSYPKIQFDSSGKMSAYTPTDWEKVSKEFKNLEHNFNQLVSKLGYQKNAPQIQNLIEVCFVDLMKMKKIDYADILVRKEHLQNRSSETPLGDSLISELHSCENNVNVLYVTVNEGIGGFWEFRLMQVDKKFVVKVRFIGAMMYRNLYI